MADVADRTLSSNLGAHDGWRYTCFATDTRAGQLAFLDARQRAHARVKDRIRTA